MFDPMKRVYFCMDFHLFSDLMQQHFLDEITRIRDETNEPSNLN